MMTRIMTSPLARLLMMMMMLVMEVRCNGSSEADLDRSKPDYVGIIADEVIILFVFIRHSLLCIKMNLYGRE